MSQQPRTWEDVERLAEQLEVAFEDAKDEDTQDGYIILIKRQGVSGMFAENKAGLAAAIEWITKLQYIMALADKHRK